MLELKPNRTIWLLLDRLCRLYKEAMDMNTRCIAQLMVQFLFYLNLGFVIFSKIT